MSILDSELARSGDIVKTLGFKPVDQIGALGRIRTCHLQIGRPLPQSGLSVAQVIGLTMPWFLVVDGADRGCCCQGIQQQGSRYGKQHHVALTSAVMFAPG